MQVLRTADAADHARAAAEQLGDQAFYVVAVSQKVAVGAMAGEDHVACLIERRHHADGASLLADRGVDRPRHQATGVEVKECLLGLADEGHLGVKVPIGGGRHECKAYQRLAMGAILGKWL